MTKVKARFESVPIEWKGVEYTIPADRMLELLAEIEGIIGHSDDHNIFTVLTNPMQTQMVPIARSLAAALRKAGCQVTDEDVYLSIAQDVASGSADGITKLSLLGMFLFELFFPAEQEAGDAGNAEGLEADQTPTAHSNTE